MKLLFGRSGVVLDDGMRADFLGEGTGIQRGRVRQGRAIRERGKVLIPSSSIALQAPRRRSSRNIRKEEDSAPSCRDDGSPNKAEAKFCTSQRWSRAF